MQERLLFRAWHGERCKMYDVRTLLWDNGTIRAVEVFSPEPGKLFELFEYGEMDYVTVMQCTGLKDTNGTLIFEGDILKNHGMNNGGRLYTVMFEDFSAAFVMRLEGEGTLHLINEDMLKYFEVIGNIHDNPELLKGGAPC